MKIIDTAIADVKILEPQVFGDERGFFMETWREDWFSTQVCARRFVQDNHSFSASKGTLRGLHYQLNPKCQAKIIRCTSGAILDVAVDIRRGSPQYKQWVAVELTEENKKQLFVPRGFAHGFLTLTDNVEVQYKADNYYAPECDGNIRYDDPEIGIDWGRGEFILSEKDQRAPLLRECQELNFIYGENT